MKLLLRHEGQITVKYKVIKLIYNLFFLFIFSLHQSFYLIFFLSLKVYIIYCNKNSVRGITVLLKIMVYYYNQITYSDERLEWCQEIKSSISHRCLSLAHRFQRKAKGKGKAHPKPYLIKDEAFIKQFTINKKESKETQSKLFFITYFFFLSFHYINRFI